MRDIDLFTLALGLTGPWNVESVTFKPEEHRLDILISAGLIPRSLLRLVEYKNERIYT